MNDYQFFSLLIIIAIGFSWIIAVLSSTDKNVNELLKRIRTIETYLSLFKSPLSVETEEKDKE